MFSMYPRPAAVTVLAIFQFMGGALWLLIVALGFVGAISAPQAYVDTSSILVWAALLGLSVFQIVCGIGLWRLRGYGRTMQIVTAWVAGNEAAAIGALRALSAAETSYAVANGGYYDSETCMAVGVIRTISARDPRAASARTCPAGWPPIE